MKLELRENMHVRTKDGYYYGQSHFQNQEVWIDKDLTIEKKKKTLYHELTHVYIREYLTSRDIEPTEEVMCDIAANSHDMIHKIVEHYFELKAGDNNGVSDI